MTAVIFSAHWGEWLLILVIALLLYRLKKQWWDNQDQEP